MRSAIVIGWVVALGVTGCARGEHHREGRQADEPPVRRTVRVDTGVVRARVDARADSLRQTFAGVRRLRWREVWGLRRDVNAEQIATAQRLGVRVSGESEIERLRRSGRLVPLGDSTEHWVLRRMEHSVPYATPDTRAMLEHLGQRFHSRLDSLGLPRYRMKITSVLRTDENQAELRKVNSNASQTVSAHEFGTTVDVSYARFSVPVPDSSAPAAVRDMESEMLEEVGKEQAEALRAELGRAIAELRQEGVLMVMMENGQPVYHMTVARRVAGADGRVARPH